MQAFLSHNSADKADARLLAGALAQHAVGIWFDEWSIRPGDSIAAGIESGLTGSDVFVLLWSAHAASSNWVGTEIRAYLHRRVQDATLRIVPVMLDATPLPALVADYRGFRVNEPEDYERVARELSGEHDSHALAQALQKRLWELAKGKIPEGSPHRYVICPQCGSTELEHMAVFDGCKERMNYAVMCMAEGCKFMRSQFGE
jgi:hypothetical protein